MKSALISPTRVEGHASEHRVTESAVMASEIEVLPDRTGYLKFASVPAWMKLEFSVYDVTILQTAFVARQCGGSTSTVSCMLMLGAVPRSRWRLDLRNFGARKIVDLRIANSPPNVLDLHEVRFKLGVLGLSETSWSIQQLPTKVIVR